MVGDFGGLVWLPRQVCRELVRLSPEARASLWRTGLGPVTRKDLRAMLAALRALPDGASAAAVGAVLARFRTAEWPDPAARSSCSFCGRRRSPPRHRMISGGSIYICEDCVWSAAETLPAPQADGDAGDDAVGGKRRAFCGFCGKRSGDEARLPGDTVRLVRGLDAAICQDCVALMVEILRDGERGPDAPDA